MNVEAFIILYKLRFSPTEFIFRTAKLRINFESASVIY